MVCEARKWAGVATPRVPMNGSAVSLFCRFLSVPSRAAREINFLLSMPKHAKTTGIRSGCGHKWNPPSSDAFRPSPVVRSASYHTKRHHLVLDSANLLESVLLPDF